MEQLKLELSDTVGFRETNEYSEQPYLRSKTVNITNNSVYRNTGKPIELMAGCRLKFVGFI